MRWLRDTFDYCMFKLIKTKKTYFIEWMTHCKVLQITVVRSKAKKALLQTLAPSWLDATFQLCIAKKEFNKYPKSEHICKPDIAIKVVIYGQVFIQLFKYRTGNQMVQRPLRFCGSSFHFVRFLNGPGFEWSGIWMHSSGLNRMFEYWTFPVFGSLLYFKTKTVFLFKLIWW
jgi:hypothetical protein